MWVISILVMRCVGIGWDVNQAVLCQYPPLHGPLLRAGDPDVLVVDLVLVVQGVWDVWHGKCPGGWDQGCHFWAPRNVLLGHIPPSLLGILGYHHDVGSPRSPLPCRPYRHPGSTEGGFLSLIEICGDRNGRIIRLEE